MIIDLTKFAEQLARIEKNQERIISILEKPLDGPIQIAPEKPDPIPAPVLEKPVSTKPDPVVSQPSIKPIDSVIDLTDRWYQAFSRGHGELILDSGKTYLINTVKSQGISGKLTIKSSGKEPAYLWVGRENYQLFVDQGEDTVLFELMDGANVEITNIWPSLRNRDKNVQQPYSVNWFSSVQNPSAKWRAVIRNCNTTHLAKNGGFGTGTLYGGTDQNEIALIDYIHAGPMLMELKNPYKDGVLLAILKNVKTDFKAGDQWDKRAFLTKGIIDQKNVLTLTGDVQTTALYNHFFITDKGSNRSFLVHIGRFTFMVDTIDAEIDRSRLQLRPAPRAGEKVFVKGGRFFFSGREPHAGDFFTVLGQRYTIHSKDKTEWDEWTNEWQKGNTPQTYKSPQCRSAEKNLLQDGEYTLEGYWSSFDQYAIERPLYLIYKDDRFFNTTLSTEFGHWRILEARSEHIAYNHRSVSIWAENVHLEGYYRESTHGEGKALYYHIKDSSGFDDEFSLKEIREDIPFPLSS